MISELLDFSIRLAKAAEEQIMPYFNHCTVDIKPDGTEVTEADRNAENAVIEMILKHYPGHSIMGEEFGTIEGSDNRYKWIIDPVDGTAWFTLGVPSFGTLIALLENEEPVIGVIHFPAMEETVYAAKGEGCWFKRKDLPAATIHVQADVPIEEAVVLASGVHSTNIHYDEENEIPYNLPLLIRQASKFRFGSDCLQHALVCRGKVHVAIDTIMSPWDIAALVPCVEEAGGVVSSLSGDRKNVIYGGSLLSSCGHTIHRETLKLLQPV
jgi:histidinol-phosphatase